MKTGEPVDRHRLMEIYRPSILSYICERRCKSGGYCFYRLNHPNAADTFFALHTLQILGKENSDYETEEFLLSLQKKDGSYPSYSAALYSCYALKLLKSGPEYDLRYYIAGSGLHTDKKGIELSLNPLPEPIHTLISLYRVNGITLPDKRREQIIRTVSGFETDSGGYGSSNPNLPETTQAVDILMMLNSPVNRTKITGFLRECEDEKYGFLTTPGTEPAYLEHIYAGSYLSAILGIEPTYKNRCINFIEKCYHPSGGFVRSAFGGSPTLEFTAKAVESEYILKNNKIPTIYHKKS